MRLLAEREAGEASSCRHLRACPQEEGRRPLQRSCLHLPGGGVGGPCGLLLLVPPDQGPCLSPVLAWHFCVLDFCEILFARVSGSCGQEKETDGMLVAVAGGSAVQFVWPLGAAACGSHEGLSDTKLQVSLVTLWFVVANWQD